jgi:hypothetical protein
VTVEFVPPTSAPRVPERVKGPEKDCEDVAAEAKVFTPVA